MAGSEAFIAAITFNSVLGVVFFILFGVLRPKFPDVFFPRRHIVDLSNFPDLGTSVFSWIKPLLSIPESVYVKEAGLDAVLFLRFLGLCIRFFAVLTVIGVLVILPVNVTGDNDDVEDFDMLSVANVPSESSRLWTHLLCSYLFTGYLLYLLNKFYAEFVDLRLKFFEESPKPHNFTILVGGVPSAKRSDADVTENFKYLYNEEFQGASAVIRTQEADDLIAKHKVAVRKLEKAWFMFNETKERPMHKTGTLGLVGPKVDSIDHWTNELKTLGPQIEDAIKAQESTKSENAFVALNSVTTAQIAAVTTHDRNPFKWTSSAAPEPSDIYWKSLLLDTNVKKSRSIIRAGIIVFLLFFWNIPAGVAALFGNFEQLGEDYEAFDFVNSLPASAIGFLEGILPSVLLAVFIALLPTIILALAAFSGLPSYSSHHSYLLEAFFLFQIFNIFLATTFAGTLFSDLKTISDDPGSLVDILANSIPTVASIFINYIILKGFAGFPGQIAQIGPVVVVTLMKKYIAKTPREKLEIVKPKLFKYGQFYPELLLMFTLGMTYSTMNSIILPICVVAFSLSYLVNRYMLLYVNRTPYESGGSMWPKVMNRVLVGVLIHQLTFVGMFSVKKAPAQSVLMLPLVVLTVWFQKYCTEKYYPSIQAMSLKDAIAVDRAYKSSKGKEPDNFIKHFTQPSRQWVPEVPDIPAEALTAAGYSASDLEAARNSHSALGQKSNASKRSAPSNATPYPVDVNSWDQSTVAEFCTDIQVRPSPDLLNGRQLLGIPDASSRSYLSQFFNEKDSALVEKALRKHLVAVRPEHFALLDPQAVLEWLHSIGMPFDSVDAIASDDITGSKLIRASKDRLEKLFGKYAADRMHSLLPQKEGIDVYPN